MCILCQSLVQDGVTDDVTRGECHVARSQWTPTIGGVHSAVQVVLRSFGSVSGLLVVRRSRCRLIIRIDGKSQRPPYSECGHCRRTSSVMYISFSASSDIQRVDFRVARGLHLLPTYVPLRSVDGPLLAIRVVQARYKRVKGLSRDGTLLK